MSVRIAAERVPVAGAAREVAREVAADPLAWALSGGEDYELVFTAPAERVDALLAAVAAVVETPIHVIGEVVPGGETRMLVLPDENEVPLTTEGWSHL